MLVDYKLLKLFLVKLLHTIIWAFYVIIIFYIVYAGITNQINIYVWISIGLVFFEGLVLLIYKWKCPLTILGSKYSENQEVGFDIFIPKWLAKHNKIIFTTIFVIGCVLVFYRITEGLG
ncbi:MAG: hypothetical protein A2Y40_04440 [Candidatus Margulisbacteria bacterium GWF2_35_9]|nr:MAG: hypothetical protein A2Y40_04440 [Candidatus Margulisbacteria bacterium GWF2_35_9]